MNDFYELLTGYDLARCERPQCFNTFHPLDGLIGPSDDLFCSELCITILTHEENQPVYTIEDYIDADLEA